MPSFQKKICFSNGTAWYLWPQKINLEDLVYIFFDLLNANKVSESFNWRDWLHAPILLSNAKNVLRHQCMILVVPMDCWCGSRLNAERTKSMQEIVCGCPGKPDAENRRSCRCNWPALIRLLWAADNSWYIIEHHENHSQAHRCVHEWSNTARWSGAG